MHSQLSNQDFKLETSQLSIIRYQKQNRAYTQSHEEIKNARSLDKIKTYFHLKDEGSFQA